MRLNRLLIRRFGNTPTRCIQQRRNLLTLAIETSCDDTSVAILEKNKDNSATLHYHRKITSDNRAHRGIYPIIAHESHQKELAGLVNDALHSLPSVDITNANPNTTVYVKGQDGANSESWKKKPDFVTATRGPGMRAGLITGVDTAKGLAVGWQIPFLGVNHMQAHALTPRLVSALHGDGDRAPGGNLTFPLLTLLVSGGHTMLVHSKSLCDHEILADTVDIAIGDMLDKAGRDILPSAMISSAENVMYARLLEAFAFPSRHQVGDGISPSEVTMDYKHEAKGNVGFRKDYDWVIHPPYLSPGPGGPKVHAHKFSVAGIGSTTKRIVDLRPDSSEDELRCVARESMRIAFQHLSSRILFALARPELKDVKTLVVSGGVACNKYLKYVLRDNLDQKGYQSLALNFPPPEYCTDNAAMIAWTGIEMWEAGWRTSLEAMAINKWSIDSKAPDGGILGLKGWINTS